MPFGLSSNRVDNLVNIYCGMFLPRHSGFDLDLLKLRLVNGHVLVAIDVNKNKEVSQKYWVVTE